MKKLFLALAALLALAGGAQAQSCSGTPNANQICAGPTSGGAGFPNFRAMVPADMPAAGAGTFNVLAYGAKGDGSTDDSAAFASAISACNAVGGTVYVPPTGHPYLINTATGNALNNGCRLMGAGTKNFPGNSPTVATTAASGSWIQCADVTNPCVLLQGHGSAIDGINFVRNQVIPSGAYTPTAFPYEISVTATFFRIEHVEMMGSTNGIQLNYSSASGGGTYSVIRDVWCSCLTVGFQPLNVNDTLMIDDVHFRNLWYETNSNVVAYEEANKIDMDIHYWDNPFVSNIEFFHSKCGMQFTDGTALSVTHSFFNGQANNLDFNLIVGAMCTASGTTHILGQFNNVYLQTDDVTPNAAAQAFALATDNVNFQFSGLIVGDAGKGVMSVGNGTGGNVYIAGATVKNYSSQTNGNVAFTAAGGANIYIASPTTITSSNGSAGATTGGAGVVPLMQNTLSGVASVSILNTNVGIQVNPGSVAFPLDVGGDTRFSSRVMHVTNGLSLSNGLNSNILLPGRGRNRVTGPTGAFSVGGFTGGNDGMVLWLYNSTGQTMTIVNEDASSTAANRIHTLSGANVAIEPSNGGNGGFATLSYDATDARWILESQGSDGAAWQTFSPAATCGTATFTTNTGKFKTIGKTTYLDYDIKINALGSCSQILTFTLPNTAQSPGMISARDITGGAGGNVMMGCAAAPGSSTATCMKTGAATFIAGEEQIGSGLYENQ